MCISSTSAKLELCSKQHKKKPAELCQAIADLAKKLNRVEVLPSLLQAFVAGRLIPLDKSPGVRPIGIGEVLRRIVSSATMALLKPDLINATAPLQTCAGLPGGIEASIHAMRQMYEDDDVEGVLLVDASNAFNALNRKAALHNVQYTCPELSTFVKNIYGCNAELFVSGSDQVVYSCEGTTQGGPESMGFYAASTTMLSNSYGSQGAKRIFYADDGSAAGKLDQLKTWWEDLQCNGPQFGYFPHAGKTWLIVKPQYLERATEIFHDVNVTTDGHRYLGSFIGTEAATDAFVKEKVSEWEKDILHLAKIAKNEPQLSYAAYIFGVSKRWQFICRTTPGVSNAMKGLENSIRRTLIPAIIGQQEISDELRGILKLPARMGGMGFSNPSEEANWEFENSKLITAQLTAAIFYQETVFSVDDTVQKGAVKILRQRKETHWKELQVNLRTTLSEQMKRLLSLSSEKGTSSWLTSLPLSRYGFRLNKQQFIDAVCMRYDLRLKDVPKFCSCGEAYSIHHCLTCKAGGYVHIRHNAVRDTFAEVLKEICKDVQIEPQLLPITGEVLPPGSNVADGARADVSAVGLWQPLNRAFLDIRVFNPHAPTNAAKEIDQMYSHHEKEKKRQYNSRIIEIEKGTFTPVIFSCSGGASPETTRLLKVIATKLAKKRCERYSMMVNYLRRRINFDILRTCVLSFRGIRGGMGHVAVSGVDIGLQPMAAGGT